MILTTGTFLKGIIHIGDVSYSAGRAGESSAEKLSESFLSLGFEIGRLKTGTPPRVNAQTIDFSDMEIQPGDENPLPFSFFNRTNYTAPTPVLSDLHESANTSGNP